MTVIGVRCKARATLTQVVKILAKAIRGNFEALTFVAKGQSKTCFVRLSETLDPKLVVRDIGQKTKLSAYIPNPKDLPPLPAEAKKRGRIPLRTRLALGIPVDATPLEILKNAHKGILEEIQYKFTGLYNLSKRNGHKLLTNLAQIILDRLKVILNTNRPPTSGFQLTSWYRRKHPHFGDFQLILGQLHEIQDAAGTPRTNLQEKEFGKTPKQPSVVDNLPVEEVQRVCSKYSSRIVTKLTDHIDSLKPCVGDTEEDQAKNKVRETLHKVSPYMDEIVGQIVFDQFMPKKAPFYRMRMYGEPTLPRKDVMWPFLKRFGIVSSIRSDHMYNVLRFSVAAARLPRLLAQDGTLVGESKLVIRFSDIPIFKAPDSILAQMKAICGDGDVGNQDQGTEYQNAELDDEYQDVEINEDEMDDEEIAQMML